MSPRDDGAVDDLRLVAPDGRVIDDALLAWRDGRITFAGAASAYPGSASLRWAGRGALATPGLVDCHTHLVFGGDRSDEFAARLRGVSYAEIARRGGGILGTVRATRAADEATLHASACRLAQDLIEDGVTTLEIKSGYGLDFESERRLLRVARRLGATLGIRVVTTYLGAHALPPEHAGDRAAYVDAVCAAIPRLADEGLVDAVDAFAERIAFSRDEVARVFAAARAAGIAVKLHADQLSDGGGAALAATFSALSADHLEWTDEAAVRAMADAGTVAVLLPGSFLVLRETKLPPIDAFRRLGVPMAIATDLNPGTSPLRSLRVAMHLGCTLFGLTPDEALAGATHVGARALGLAGCKGTLQAGADADFVLWDAPGPAALSYWIGGRLARTVVAAGRIVAGNRP